ncbi:hypothetical protein CYMTET_4049 [Cymbomonas tetramitiformis]|uniref:Uncharacterized protein n=1 Tax=Cymbomonas tetramitiformis TaxID=36881 RepID=A0AAE0H3S5_9CHLO|nr:hypothetical protein CYMTET_4049 [Cymbomonas tetramitiformis]
MVRFLADEQNMVDQNTKGKTHQEIMKSMRVGDDLSYRRQVVLNDNGSVRWKVVLEGTWEPPTLHETDVRCVRGAWPYIVVGDDGSLRRWERQLGYGWYLADATRPKEPVQPFDVNERPWRSDARPGASARRSTLLTSMVEEYKGIPYMGRRRPSMDEEPLDPVVGKQAGSREAGEIPTVDTATRGIEITYVDCDPPEDEPASPAYSPTSPVYCPTSPSDSGAVVPDALVCTVQGCVRCAQDRGASVTVDLIQETGTEHPAEEMMTGGAGGASGLIVDPPSSSGNDTDVAPRRMPKRRRKNVAPNRAKYPLPRR